MSRTRIVTSGTIALALVAIGAFSMWSREKSRNAKPLAQARTVAQAEVRGILDPKITIDGVRQLARRLAAARERRLLEQLGWNCVKKARITVDDHFYDVVLEIATAMEEAGTDRPSVLLLRGHALESLHRFPEAERAARAIVAEKELMLGYALLGDALMEQGRVDEAVGAYQKMVDLRPCLESYTRIAHVRWLKGDMEGAMEMIREAVATGTPRDPEPLAWTLNKMASYQLANGDYAGANASLTRALELLPEHPAALYARGRLFLAQNRAVDAVSVLRKAVHLDTHPEYRWALGDALRVAGMTEEAAQITAKLSDPNASPDAHDRRSISLYLATTGENPEQALRLAREELELRQDIFTYDALAWASYAAGRFDDAVRFARDAAAHGTQDARLRLHAAVIAAKSNAANAAELGRAAEASRAQLLPSERQALDRVLSDDNAVGASSTTNTKKTADRGVEQ